MGESFSLIGLPLPKEYAEAFNIRAKRKPADTTLSAGVSYSALVVNFHRERNTMPTLEQTVTSTISWFEIPTSDFPRAIRFYETIFASPLKHEAGRTDLAIFSYQRPGVSMALAFGRD